MEARLVTLSLLLTALVPLAAPTASAACTPPVSQWGACVEGWCVAVDGPAMHVERCVPVDRLGVCTPPWSQWQVCVDWPCVVVDGPAMHREVCFDRVMA